MSYSSAYTFFFHFVRLCMRKTNIIVLEYGMGNMNDHFVKSYLLAK